MRYVLIILLVLIYTLAGIPSWYIDMPFLQQSLAYSFFHASIWHLAANCLGIWSILRPANFSWYKCLLAAAISIMVYPLSFLRPCIGISNFLYAYMGMGTPNFKSPWWKKKETIVFLALTVLMVFIPRISAVTHIAAFALGVAVAAINRKYSLLMNDAGRYLK